MTTCTECGVSFQPTQPAATCSNRCRQRRFRRLHAERDAATFADAASLLENWEQSLTARGIRTDSLTPELHDIVARLQRSATRIAKGATA